MSSKLTKIALTATLMLALTFAFSCSGGDNGGNNEQSSSSSEGVSSSSSYLSGLSSSVGDGSSSSVESVVSSSSGDNVVSSSSVDASLSSSSSVSAECTSWGDWIETTPATCNAVGLKMRACTSDLSKTETQGIPKVELGATQFCLNGTVTNKCGGTTEYASTQFCQNGTNAVKDLCGRATYTAKQFCQRPNVVRDLCGTETYTATEFCQSPNVVKDLCGSKTYTTTQFCQSPNVVKDLCGSEIYTATQFCQSGTNAVKDLCGTATYTATQFCQSGTNAVKNLCGGTATYNDVTEFCSNGVIKIYGTMVDDSDKSYKTVEIEGQIWMAENNNYDVPSNDTDVCYDNKPNNCNTYGRLYNWETAKTACPSGWHLPDTTEWKTLITATEIQTNSFGFSALPGGYGNSVGGFYGVGVYGYWWTATENNATNAYARSINRGWSVDWDNRNKGSLFSVRCLQDD